MKTRVKVIAMSVIAMICFSVSVNAQKLTVAIIDRQNAAETANYKFIMGVLASIYVVYLVLHNKRRREVNRFLGKEEVK